jgi:protease secretion system outer membrane protein
VKLTGRIPKVVLRAMLLVLLCPAASQSAPLNLSEACRHARDHDAQVRSAEADVKISNEEVSKAVSAFKPTIRASTSRGRNVTESFTPFLPDGNKTYYNTLSHSVSLRQAVFNMGDIASLKQSKAVRAKSESILQNERSGVLIRTAEAFLNVLYAKDNVEFTKAQTRATFEQLQQARRRYRDGFGTITEINEAQASYDMGVAEESSAVTGLDYSRRELERITGVSAEDLSSFLPERMTLESFESGKVNYWIELAMKENAKIGAAKQEIQIASREVEKNRASRYPAIDLVAGRSYSVSENNYTIGSTYDTWSVNLQMSVPIYTGGYTSAAIRQSIARRMKADEQCDLQARGVESDVRKFYNGVINGVVQVKAFEQALKSNEIALEGTKKGFGAGLRSNVDVLNAQQKLLESRRNLAKARYMYILDRLMLKDAAGVLTDSDIDEVNHWFGAASHP